MARTKQSSRTGGTPANRQRRPRQAAIWPKIFSPTRLWAEFSFQVTRYYNNMEYLSYEQRCFLEEYGPPILDFFLALPGIAYLRLLFRRYAGSSYNADAETPLLDLPDELLLMIVEYLRPECLQPWCPAHYREYRDFVTITRTHRRFRQVLAPALYKDVAIRHGWCRSRRALSLITVSPHIQEHVRTLKLAPRPPLGTLWMPSVRLGPELAVLLPKLADLRALNLYVPDKQVPRFRKDVLKSKISLPNIRSLVLGPGMDCMISLCPNVECVANTERQWRDVRYSGLESRGRPLTGQALAFAASFVKHVHHFELHLTWNTEHLRYVADLLPRLRSFAMHGELLHQAPEEFLPILRDFQNLQTLVLPPVEDLGVGLFRHGYCGNGFMGPEGRKALREMQRRHDQEALEYARPVALQVFQALPNLDRLWIGERRLFTPVFTPTGVFKNVAFRYEQWLPM